MSHLPFFMGQPMISQYLLDEARTDPKANASLKKVIKKKRCGSTPAP
jgi:hypothetical protein